MEAFDYFGTGSGENHQGWGSVAVVGFEQLHAGGGVETHVPFFENHFLGFEKNLHQLARETAGLSEEQDS